MAYLPLGTPFLGLADVPSLLWRLALVGRRGLPWAVAASHVREHFPRGANVFGELHLAMVAAASGDHAALAAGAARLQKLLAKGHEGAPVAASWVEALQAWLGAQGAAALAALEACERKVARLGGSRAQRSVVETAIDAVQRGVDAHVLSAAAAP